MQTYHHITEFVFSKNFDVKITAAQSKVEHLSSTAGQDRVRSNPEKGREFKSF